MKAYEVIYSTGGSSGNSVTVLVKDEKDLESALAEKTEYDNSRWSKIERKREIPLSRVMIKDLSVTEFLVIKELTV